MMDCYLGFSMSFCIPSVCRGEMDIDRIAAVVTNTRIQTHKQLQGVCRDYAEPPCNSGLSYEQWLDTSIAVMLQVPFVQYRLDWERREANDPEFHPEGANGSHLHKPVWAVPRSGWFRILPSPRTEAERAQAVATILAGGETDDGGYIVEHRAGSTPPLRLERLTPWPCADFYNPSDARYDARQAEFRKMLKEGRSQEPEVIQ
jgi:hypothetical protein